MSPISSRATSFQFILRGDERIGILYGVMELLRRTNGSLRACGFCHKPILKSKRLEYCSPECSRAQREKNRQQQRAKSRLLNLLTKFNVFNQLSGKKKQADDLLEKLRSTKDLDEFWKHVDNGDQLTLQRYLALKGRKPKDLR